MKNKTKTLLCRRRQIIEEWASGPYDYVVTAAVHFSGTIPPYVDDPEERDRRVAMFRERRARWLRKQFPDEMWRIPILTSFLLPEAGTCYMNGAHYATVAMCQAVTESVLRRHAGGFEGKYWRLVRKLSNDGVLTSRERDDLFWLSRIRNPALHTGSHRKYAKALVKGLMPVIVNGKVTEQTPIESNCRRALKIAVRLLHHLCPENSEPES